MSPYPFPTTSVLLYGLTTWPLTKRKKKKLERSCTRMLRAILNKSQKQYSTKQHLCSHLPPISKTIKVRRINIRHTAGEARTNSYVTFSSGLLHKVMPVLTDQQRTYQHQLCVDTGCSLEDTPEAMDDRDGWGERVREIPAGNVTW